MSKVEQLIAHYASQYYDPQKAHEYYEEHKKLSDKAAKSALTSKAQRDTFAVSKENINKAKTSEVTKMQADEVQRLATLRANAKAASDKINSTLDELVQQLKSNLTTVKVNEIPANATPEQRAFLESQNRMLRAKAAQDNRKQYHDAAGQASRDRASVSASLSSAISKARDDYSASMKALQSKYADITAKEQQNIHDQVAGAP